MNQHTLLRVLLLATVVFCNSTCVSKDSLAIMAQWSKEATFLAYDGESRRSEVISPDRKKIAVIKGVKLDVIVDDKRFTGLEHEGVSTLAELGWSPDSTAFFVTESYGGVVGDWHVTVYLIEDGRVRGIDVTRQVVKEFNKHYRCRAPHRPNIGAVKWMNGSRSLLLIAEVPPHSNCPEMGKVRGYVVAVPTGQIVDEFDEAKLIADWGHYLGKRFIHK